MHTRVYQINIQNGRFLSCFRTGSLENEDSVNDKKTVDESEENSEKPAKVR